MPYAVVHQFAGGTKEQYEASVAAVHPADGSLRSGSCTTRPARRTTAGPSSPFTTRSTAGRPSATASSVRGWRQASPVASTALRRRRSSRSTRKPPGRSGRRPGPSVDEGCVDELAELAADRVGARREQLRVERRGDLLVRVDPERRARRPAPGELAR